MLTGPAPAVAEGAGGAPGMTGRRHRPVGDQRGVRRRADADHEGPRHDPRKVNVNGGAIALGHPLGATGAMLSAPRSTSSSARRPPRLVTLCVGGGMGIATIIERV